MSDSFRFPLSSLPPAIVFNPPGTYGIQIQLYTPVLDDLPAGWSMEKAAEVYKRISNYLRMSALTRVDDQTSITFLRRYTTGLRTWTILLFMRSVVSPDEFQTVVKDAHLFYVPEPVPTLVCRLSVNPDPGSPNPFTVTGPSPEEVLRDQARTRAMQTLPTSFSAIGVLRMSRYTQPQMGQINNI
ncbi:hypothetical protein BD410DRAFT_795613 [Rickenella mellea]|uniref:Uncharacterized protein n=1 Tax=Rickenella mellea TaxID=50990 RepID=A0A4Y7PLM4_9AGAM|nr:hypothetical protein BD410DRAFT_795613 [Rickenella mellea]